MYFRAVFLIQVLLSGQMIWCESRFYHYNFTYNNRLNNATFEVNTTKWGGFNFSYALTVYNFQEIIQEIIIFEIRVPKDNVTKDFEISLLKTTVNMCKFGATMESNVFLKNMYQSFVKNCQQFEMKCPFPKGRYYISSCYFPDLCKGICAKIPNWVPPGRVNFSIKTMGRSGKKSRMTELYHLNTFLVYEK